MVRFILNRAKLDALCTLRGWKHPSTDLAREIGFTRSYIRLVLAGTEEPTAEFMRRYIEISGVKTDSPLEWGSLFVLIKTGLFGQKHLNFEKYHGRVPYKKGSISAEFRRKDRKVVEESDDTLFE